MADAQRPGGGMTHFLLGHSLAWWVMQMLRLAAAWMGAAVLFALWWIHRRSPVRPPQLLTNEETEAILLRVKQRSAMRHAADAKGVNPAVFSPAPGSSLQNLNRDPQWHARKAR